MMNTPLTRGLVRARRSQQVSRSRNLAPGPFAMRHLRIVAWSRPPRGHHRESQSLVNMGSSANHNSLIFCAPIAIGARPTTRIAVGVICSSTKNQGDRAGATLEHVHSQLIAHQRCRSKPSTSLAVENALRLNGRCIYCEMIQRDWTMANDWSRLESFRRALPFCISSLMKYGFLPRITQTDLVQSFRTGTSFALALRVCRDIIRG